MTNSVYLEGSHYNGASEQIQSMREKSHVVIKSGEELFDIISGWNLCHFSAVYDT